MFCFSKKRQWCHTVHNERHMCWQELGVWGEHRQAEAEGVQLHGTEAVTAAESPGPSGIEKFQGSSWSDSCVLLSLRNEMDWPHFWFFFSSSWVNLSWPCLSHISVSSPPAPHQSFSQSKYSNWQTALHNVNSCWWTFYYEKFWTEVKPNLLNLNVLF